MKIGGLTSESEEGEYSDLARFLDPVKPPVDYVVYCEDRDNVNKNRNTLDI